MIEVPVWVPARVAQTARFIFDQFQSTDEAEAIAALTRLTCDVRMRDVWQDLDKRVRRDHRPTEKPFYRSTLPAAVESWGSLAAAWRARARQYRELGDALTAEGYEQNAAAMEEFDRKHPPTALAAEERHQLALATFFAMAVAAYQDRSRTVSRAEVNRVISDSVNKSREGQAAAYRRAAADPDVSRLIVARHRTDSRLEAFVETLARWTTQIFGVPLYGIIATTANVAFERTDLDRQRIRAMLKTRAPTAPSA